MTINTRSFIVFLLIGVLFTGCGNAQMSKALSEVKSPVADMSAFKWEGGYLDESGAYAVMTIDKKDGGNKYDVSIYIPGGEDYFSLWRFEASYDSRVNGLVYSGAIKTDVDKSLQEEAGQEDGTAGSGSRAASGREGFESSWDSTEEYRGNVKDIKNRNNTGAGVVGRIPEHGTLGGAGSYGEAGSGAKGREGDGASSSGDEEGVSRRIYNDGEGVIIASEDTLYWIDKKESRGRELRFRPIERSTVSTNVTK